jgi:hypothetical protein
VRGYLRTLRYLLKALGDEWAFVLTNVTQGSQGNDERLAFLIDTRRVSPPGWLHWVVMKRRPLGRL